MSDEYVAPPSLYTASRERAIAESEAKARIIRDTAQVCVACGKSMLRWGGGRTRHFSCDPDFPLAGTRCTCPPACSESHWGNGPTPCDPACLPCKRMAGKSLTKRRGVG